MSVKVSIVIPIYNASAYLRECLNSVLAQTYTDIEVICVDDGSTDGTWEILSEYVQNDNRLRAFRQENQFAGVARNNGFSYITGDYVCFWDADDVFSSTCIEKMVSKAEKSRADIVICKWDMLDNVSGTVHSPFPEPLCDVPKEKDFSKFDLPNRIFQVTNTWVWDKLYCVDFLKEHSIEFQNTRIINDALFCCVAYAEAKTIAIVDEALVQHRMNIESSIESSRAPYWRSAYDFFDKLHDELSKRGFFQSLKQSYINVVADRIVNYVCNITEWKYFHEAFDYYNRVAKTKYNLIGYPEDYYFDRKIYEKLLMLSDVSEEEYLCGIYCDKKKEVIDRCRDIWILEQNIEILGDKIQSLEEMIKVWSSNKRWCFGEDIYPLFTRFIICGYGKVGKDFARQLANSRHSNLIAVIDKNYNTIDEPYLKDVKVGDLSILSDIEFDYVIISPRKEELAKEIRSELISAGVTEGKIICPVLDDKNE